MVKKILLTLCSTYAFLTVQAQDVNYAKSEASASYKTAVGLRYSVDGLGRSNLGITAKYYIREQSALEAYATLPIGSRAFLASLSYNWRPKLTKSERLRPYAGIGGGVLRHRESEYGPEGKAYFSPVFFGTVGIEYQFEKLPMALSLDYRTRLLSTDQRAPHPNHVSRIGNLGIGLNYTFR